MTKVKFTEVASQEKAKSAEMWKSGEKMIGWLVSSKEIESSFGKNKVYSFIGGDNNGKPTQTKFDLMGSGGLNWQLDLVQVGTFCMIECLGTRLNPETKRKFVELKVYKDEAIKLPSSLKAVSGGDVDLFLEGLDEI